MTSYIEVRHSQADSWADRVRQVVEMTESTMKMAILNPEDVVCNVVCNSCGRITSGTMDHAPEGWTLGKFGENDYCPGCRNLRT